jgi:hypothetical protein
MKKKKKKKKSRESQSMGSSGSHRFFFVLPFVINIALDIKKKTELSRKRTEKKFNMNLAPK